MNDLISVIVPIYNVEKYLNKCIDSIISQTYKNLEIILIDDGSPDRCPQMCDEYSKKDNRIKVIHKENGGVSFARNIGLINSTGKYILFIDSDDYIDMDMIEFLVNNIQLNDNYDMSACGYYLNNNPIFEKNRECLTLTNVEGAKYIAGKNHCKLRGFLWNKLFKREIINKFNIIFPTDIYFCEDAYFCQLYLKRCHSIIYNCKPKYHYIERINSATHTLINEKKLSVLDAYKGIMDCCKDYNNSELNNILYANYISHNILLLKSACDNNIIPSLYKSINNIYIFLINNKNKVIFNKYISIKQKLKYIYSIFFYKRIY